MIRQPSTRDVLKFELRCSKCSHIRTRELFVDESYNHVTEARCDLCLRKKERIRQGLVNPENYRAGAVSAAHKRTKLEKENAELAFRDWKKTRNAELEAQGIPPWLNEYWEIMNPEIAEMAQRLGIESA